MTDDDRPEPHYANRVGWLRAAVLGANDGIVSTASLIVGVAAAPSSRTGVVLAGVAGMVAGAMSMAAGEYVSVSSQSDSENADLERERRELADDPEGERRELAAIYVDRGLRPELADQVARELTEHDALAAHARDELGIHDQTAARPLQAAVSSAVSFVVGAGVPLLAILAVPRNWFLPTTYVATLACLILLGFVSARLGGADPVRAIARVTFWGGTAMAATTAVGRLFGVVA